VNATLPPRLEPTTPIDTAALGGLRSAMWDLHEPVLPAQTVLYLYETRWDYVDQGAIAADEAALLRRLVDELGNGVFLGHGQVAFEVDRYTARRRRTA
jgi:hypothetical protein